LARTVENYTDYKGLRNIVEKFLKDSECDSDAFREGEEEGREGRRRMKLPLRGQGHSTKLSQLGNCSNLLATGTWRDASPKRVLKHASLENLRPVLHQIGPLLMKCLVASTYGWRSQEEIRVRQAHGPTTQ
jgi:hypothetical protein